jgi:hypothetical protein
MKNKKTKINKLCQVCQYPCKQNDETILLGCKNYKYEPQQLEFKFSFARKKKKDYANYNRKI